jgi:hypothetical protein
MRARIRDSIDALAVEPRPSGAVKLAGRDDFRIRVGEYRIVYAVDDAARIVLSRGSSIGATSTGGRCAFGRCLCDVCLQQ